MRDYVAKHMWERGTLMLLSGKEKMVVRLIEWVSFFSRGIWPSDGFWILCETEAALSEVWGSGTFFTKSLQKAIQNLVHVTEEIEVIVNNISC